MEADMPETIRLDTVGKLADHGYEFGVQCDDCRHWVRISCKSVADRLGRDHDFRVADKFQCSKCGSKKITVHIYPPVDPPKERMW